ncbi:polypeptide N-acetylgalactosaminyltransferase 18 [Tachysurus ichikawai]
MFLHVQILLCETPLKSDSNQEDRSFSDSSLFSHWGQDLNSESRRVALKMFQYYGYNGYLSERLPMDRAIPDYRPEGCKNMSYASNLPQVSIVFIFVNEALSVILRSVHSAMNKTPGHLLKEIILVDDNSSSACSERRDRSAIGSGLSHRLFANWMISGSRGPSTGSRRIMQFLLRLPAATELSLQNQTGSQQCHQNHETFV